MTIITIFSFKVNRHERAQSTWYTTKILVLAYYEKYSHKNQFMCTRTLEIREYKLATTSTNISVLPVYCVMLYIAYYFKMPFLLIYYFHDHFQSLKET